MMGASWETVAVVVIVAAAVAWAARAARRAVTRKKVCSSCGSSGDCPLADAGSGAGPGSPLPLAGSCAHPPGGSRDDRS